MKLLLRNVRLSFPALFEAKSVNGEGDPAFSASLIIAGKKGPQVDEINKALEAVAKEKWADKAGKVLADLRKGDKLCVHDGDSKEYDGYSGNLFISARNKSRPLILDADKSQLAAADGRPYGGCYVNASLDLWAQDNQFGKRINASLKGVQFVKDGDAFGGGAPADPDDFDDVTAPGGADDLV